MSAATGRTRWWRWFLVVVALGSVWALSSPIASTPDEPAHVVKAVATVRGQLNGEDVVPPDLRPDYVPGALTRFRVPKGYADLLARPTCYSLRPDQPAGCMDPVVDDTTTADADTQAGHYPPLYYAIVGWPSLVLPPGPAVYGMRLISVLLCAALVATGLTAAQRMRGGRWVLIGAAIALTPLAFFCFGSVNPSALEIAAGFAFWLLALELVADPASPSARPILRVAAVGLLLAGSRPLSPVFVVMIVVSVGLLAMGSTRLRQLKASPAMRSVSVVAVLVGLFAVYSMATSDLRGAGIRPNHTVSHLDAAWDSICRLGFRATEGIGKFGWLDTPLPAWLTVGWLLVAGVLVTAALVLGTNRQRVVLVLTTVAVFSVQVLGEAVQGPKIGFYWHERYSLPVIVGVPLLAGWIVGASGKVDERVLQAAAIAVGCWVALGQFAAHSIWMRRNMVGADHPVFSYLAGTGWDPPVAAWVLGLAGLAASVGYGWWFVVTSRDRLVGAAPPAGSVRGARDRDDGSDGGPGERRVWDSNPR